MNLNKKISSLIIYLGGFIMADLLTWGDIKNQVQTTAFCLGM